MAIDPNTLIKANELGQQASKITGIKFNPIRIGGNMPEPSVPSTLSSANLSVGRSFDLPPAPISTTGARVSGALETRAKQGTEYLNKAEQERQQLQEAQSDSQSDLEKTLNRALGVYEKKSDLQEQFDITGKTQAVNEARSRVSSFNDQILAEQEGLRKQIEKLEKQGGGLTSGLEVEKDRLTRESVSKQSDLALLKLSAQRDFENTTLDLNSAQTLINDKIDTQLEPLKLKLDWNKYFDERNYNKLDKAEQRVWDAIKTEDQRQYDTQKTELENAHNVWVKAAENGAPSSVQQSILRAINEGDYMTANTLASPYLFKDTGSGVPTVKTINGVDMQWDPTTKTWVSIGGTTENIKNSIDQLSFLRDTAKEAARLSSASGASGISKFIGDKFIGDTRFRQLEAQTNTLRTNVLTLMTDPGVKKYFGPQMSEADVRLMTAAGTTLNPENQSPAQLKAEIVRLDNLFSRMQEAVNQGAKSGGNSLTKSGKTFDVAAAKAAGYTEKEIQDYLNSH